MQQPVDDLRPAPGGAGPCTFRRMDRPARCGGAWTVCAIPSRAEPAARDDRPDYACIRFEANAPAQVEDTEWIGERVCAALRHRLDDAPPERDPLACVFALPQADAHGRLREVVIYAAGGLAPAAVRALGFLQRLDRKGGPPLTTTLVALGRCDALTRPPACLGRARVWHSATPFVPPRRPEHRGGVLRDGPEDLLRRLCRASGHGEPSRVRTLDPEETRGRHLLWFRRHGQAPGHGLRLEFAEEVQGPLAFGYGAQFGLGQFTPMTT